MRGPFDPARVRGPCRFLGAIVALAVAVGLEDRPRAEGKTYLTDLDAFFNEVDKTYPFFDLKGIRKDWALAKQRLSVEVRRCRSDTEFLGIVSDAIRCLRDAHMYLHGAKAELPKHSPEYHPGVSFLPAVKGQVVVMSAQGGPANVLKTGTVVARIDGKNSRAYLEARAKKAWAEGGSFSSPQRARLFEYRIPLRGKKGEGHTLTYLDGRRPKRVKVQCNVEAIGWPHTYNLPPNLARVGRSFAYTKLEGGVGYMYWRRIDSSINEGMSKAFGAHPDAKGWIVDIRGNGGGGYDEKLIQQLREMPRPVAGIIDAGCFSAGETIARDLVQFAGARLLGSTTAGSSSAKRSWTFPSGIASVVFPTRSRWGIGRKPIEFNGIAPHEEVEVVPEEAMKGLNSAILRAEAYILKEAAKQGGGRT